VTVTARDQFGNVATSYAGTVHFTSTDSTAILPANYTFGPADAGTHTFSVTLKTAGTQTITGTDTVTGNTTGTTGAITVNAAPATRLAVAASPTSIVAGGTTSVTVTAQDAYANSIVGYLGTIHFTSTDLLAVLPMDYAFVAADSGSHTFSVTLKTAGVPPLQTVTARDTVTSITGTSNPITVTAGSVIKLILVAAPTSITAGGSVSAVVTAVDPFNNPVPTYTGSIQFTSSDPQAAFSPSSYTFVAGDAGVHTFTNVATLKTAGNRTVTATDRGTSSINGSATVTVSMAAASQLVFTVEPTNAKAGAMINPPVQVAVQDAYGNTITTSNASVTVAKAPGSPSGTLSGTLIVNATNGVATFGDLAINAKGSNYSLTATTSALPTATSSTFNIT
jgi:hypothetical protein